MQKRTSLWVDRHSLAIKYFYSGLLRTKKGAEMQTVLQSYRGLSLIVGLNWDRIFFFGTLIVGLLSGIFLGQAINNAFPAMDAPAAF
jgi:hypothetical protein